ncbi:hypothetical protein GobsT_40450 [Gemmata obscuriglobus]|uniref:DUF418 domain-containing protein n=1 Tax=Gemmata obscuriglobus TaxID=114 RepID=A0A2Z3H870_9BACT|nr:DUF418 domain-containing protein [Gemmata obscuriglobus]AWM37894.1 DUF418 domain-containing protein [Gemmata obscuriglobus]QEG29254.1 hypothetical protein GobsT_40450 [Gemmata obscuriglobus]VTS08085.1 Putative membrane protein OS=Novosphingobium sp. AP12 GN=PMI02_04478 PE=4 SV=1: DUF418 [Gemmata obscuriglobus UQM 2246]
MSANVDEDSAGSRSERPRVQVLDALRGIAILGIFFINIPIMVESPGATSAKSTAPSPEHAGGGVGLLVDGTQRGLLQMLFGAGMLLLTARVARPDGPVAVADDYFRRNLWLLGIGLVHVFLVRWAYDIVHVYALAALFLFPFRLVRPITALLLGLTFAALTLVGTVPGFGGAAGPDFGSGVAAGALARDRAVEMWLTTFDGFGFWSVLLESLCTMLVGVALFKWGVLQGLRSRPFYLTLAVVAYAIGCTVRLTAPPPAGSGAPGGWDFGEVGRLSLAVGHIAAVNLAWQTAAGRWLLYPFIAAGRTALSLYVTQSVVGLWVLASLPGITWAAWAGGGQLVATAAAVVLVQLVLANLWVRFFKSGPVEWCWHRLLDLSRPSAINPRTAAGAVQADC